MAAGRILATDLDGTLIPLASNSHNQRALRRLRADLCEHRVTLTYVTGRHIESVFQAIDAYGLPEPDWIISDVGTAIYRHRGGSPTGLQRSDAYHEHLEGIVAEFPIAELRDQLSDVADARLQEPEKQGPFKLSYYVEQSRLQSARETFARRLAQRQAPYSLVHSLDPISGRGLIDLLPRDVSKAYALDWWCQREQLPMEAVVYAGDSGNDLAALTAGYRCIVVANADPKLAAHVVGAHRAAGWTDRLCLANAPGTSGVLEGCRSFGLLPHTDPPSTA